MKEKIHSDLIAQPLQRRHLLLLIAITGVGVLLRIYGIERLSLCHFDEGVYCTSGFSVATEGPYSFVFAQPIQSPPLFPWMIGAICWVTQATWPGFSLFVTATLGAASVPLLFLLVRRSSSNGQALCAAFLLASSDFHVAYSRMALTDGPLTFWFILTMYCATRLREHIYAPHEAVLQRSRPTGQTRPQHAPRVPVWLKTALWTLATALAGGAAWNTKYNGWLIFAIAISAAAFLLGSDALNARARRGHSPGIKGPNGVLLFCLIIAAIAGGITYLPWYYHVEMNFQGGYRAVLENHRSYFSGPAAWPENAVGMVSSLAALRHWGWVLVLVLTVVGGLAWGYSRDRAWKRRAGMPGFSAARLFWGAVLPLALLALALTQGVDAAIFVLAAAGVPFALLKPSWGPLLAAMCTATFLCLAPLYHPYPRLLLPALPASICLAVWLLDKVWIEFDPTAAGSSALSKTERYWLLSSLGAAAALGAMLLLHRHPFGVLPSHGVWNRFGAQESYRAAEVAILKNTKPDAVILCQTQPVMVAYCPREIRIVENESFAEHLRSLPPDRESFLVVDFCWLYGQGPDAEALRGLRDHARRLTPVAAVPNDLNVVALLDYLPPKTVVEKVSRPLPPYHEVDRDGRKIPLPPPLAEPFQDVIVLYRIAR